MQETIDRACK